MIGYRFADYIPDPQKNNPFQNLLDIFTQLLTFTSGDVEEALSWLTALDKEHGLTADDYGLGDFIQDLKDKGFIEDDPQKTGFFQITSKTERTIRQQSLEEIFGRLKKSSGGNHPTVFSGFGDDKTSDRRDYQFGDSTDQIAMTDSIRNAQVNHGLDFNLTENDLSIIESEYKTHASIVVMIDISHSMILYGEDRITPAKKVAMALAELMKRKYPKDTLDIIVFGDDAWQIELKDLPYLRVGPFHTNTVAGLELAIQILRRRKTNNKQIFMITDGKPTCLKQGLRYYKNSFGLDRRIINKTLNQATRCRKLGISITTFMVAKDPYLQQFVRQFTQANNGRAFYSSLKGLGEYVFEDYIRNRKKRLR